MADGPLPTEGVDYAWSRPNIAQLAAAGKRFACRYGGAGSIGKQLDPGEAQALSAAGVAIVANVEGAANGLLGGFSAGVSWARGAETHFRTCGMPAGRPIYLSVDFDVTSSQWPTVANALRGAASVLGGVHRVGVYGSYDAMVWARRDGVAKWFWQTYAWSERRWAPGNHIEQYLNGVQLAGATLDLDRALATDFGQWFVGGKDVDDMTPDEHQMLANAERILTCWDSRRDAVGVRYLGHDKDEPVYPNPFVEILGDLDSVTTPPPATVDIPALVEALRPVIAEESEKAVRKALGSLDEETTKP